YYLVMEYIAGGTLKQRLEELTEKQESMALGKAVQLGYQVAEALDYAHRQGVLRPLHFESPHSPLQSEHPSHIPICILNALHLSRLACRRRTARAFKAASGVIVERQFTLD
ncbi:MAG: hypothetical protein HGA28_07300, partial [Anaerolineaceae bacterium]|nr:hypothetical protein [Anaerolineaceae bacterium]